MENPWRAPVVAVEDGRVEHAESSLGGCMLYLYGRSGTMYLYIHLNNDLTSRNDNKGGCVNDVTFAVPDGARVSAGQISGSTLRTLKKPVAVTASTLRANATPEAMLGAPGELMLGRVSPTP
jgi:hypothetical protein